MRYGILLFALIGMIKLYLVFIFIVWWHWLIFCFSSVADENGNTSHAQCNSSHAICNSSHAKRNLSHGIRNPLHGIRNSSRGISTSSHGVRNSLYGVRNLSHSIQNSSHVKYPVACKTNRRMQSQDCMSISYSGKMRIHIPTLNGQWSVGTGR